MTGQKQLAHGEDDGGRVACNSVEWSPARRQMLQDSADFPDDQMEMSDLIG